MKGFTEGRNGSPLWILSIVCGALVVLAMLLLPIVYFTCRINVAAGKIAVLTHKVGVDLSNGEEIAENAEKKGVQKDVLTEGRHFRNPYNWGWSVYPMPEIPQGKMGVRIRLYGNDLPYGDFLAKAEADKGIVEEVLAPGRYAYNAMVVDGKTKQVIGEARPKADYAEIIEIWDPTIIPAGYRGVVTNLAGPLSPEANNLLVQKGFRGTQEETLTEGTYYRNPYFWRIDPIDCRSQRFNLSEGADLTLLSKDGFRIQLDGIVEFRIEPNKAAETFVLFNELTNDESGVATIDDEIVNKIVLPNARSFCRLKGANSTAVEFIGGETRSKFQVEFQSALTSACREQGVEIVQALVTKVVPPAPITQPLQGRELARQQLVQYGQQVGQQLEEAKLATEKGLVEQRRKLVEAGSAVIMVQTQAVEDQGVALAEANRDKDVAERKLAAAKDQAEAILAKGRAEAEIVRFRNAAEAAKWQQSIAAFGGDGSAFAEYALSQKMAKAYSTLMINSDGESPLLRFFKEAPAVVK